MAVESEQQVGSARTGAGAQTDSASVPRRSGSTNDARRISGGLTSAHVGFWFRAVYGLCQWGEPGVGGTGEQPAAHFRANGSGCIQVTADGTGANGEYGARAARRNRRSGACVLLHAPHPAARISKPPNG